MKNHKVDNRKSNQESEKKMKVSIELKQGENLRTNHDDVGEGK